MKHTLLIAIVLLLLLGGCYQESPSDKETNRAVEIKGKIHRYNRIILQNQDLKERLIKMEKELQEIKALLKESQEKEDRHARSSA